MTGMNKRVFRLPVLFRLTFINALCTAVYLFRPQLFWFEATLALYFSLGILSSERQAGKVTRAASASLRRSTFKRPQHVSPVGPIEISNNSDINITQLLNKTQNIGTNTAVLSAVAVISAPAFVRLTQGSHDGIWGPAYVAGILTIALIVCSLVVGQFMLFSTRADATRLLLAMLSGESLGPDRCEILVRALQIPNSNLRERTKRQLIEILRGIGDHAAAAISPSLREILLKCVVNPQLYANHWYDYVSRDWYRKDAEFRIAILGVINRIGSEGDLEIVEGVSLGAIRLTDGTSYPPEIIQAAEKCARDIRVRLEAHAGSRTLVRPSSDDTSSGSVLVRASSDTPGLASADLLRSSTRPHNLTSDSVKVSSREPCATATETNLIVNLTSESDGT